MNNTDFIIGYESGEIIDLDEMVAGFQQLIDTKLINHLQGSYGRMAHALIENGLCSVKGE